jgi:uncharacterized protein YkwD
MRSRTFEGGASRTAGRLARCLAGVLAAAAVSGASIADARAAGCPGADRVPRAGTLDQAATATICVINRERAQRGLRRLRARAALERAGRRYARDMARRRFFSHTSPSGSSMVDRLRAVGYAVPDRAWSVGEALAWGTRASGRATPAATVSAWLASRPHRRLLLDADFRDIGVGVAKGIPLARWAGTPGATYAAELGVRW